MLLDVVDGVLDEMLGGNAFEAFMTSSGLNNKNLTPHRLHENIRSCFKERGSEIERVILTRLFHRLELPFINDDSFEATVEEVGEIFKKRALDS